MSTWTLQFQVDFQKTKTKKVFWRKNNWLNDTGLLEIPSYGLAIVILLYGGRRIPYFGCVWTTLMTIGTWDKNNETNNNLTELIFQVNAPLWNLTALHFLSARRPTHPCPCNCALWWALVLPLRRFSKGLIFNNNFFSGKMCITFSFGVIFLYGAELFPTEIRTSGIGSASFVGRSLSIINYYRLKCSIFGHLFVPTAGIKIITTSLKITSTTAGSRSPPLESRSWPSSSSSLSRSSSQLPRISLPRFGGMFAPWVEQAGRAYQMPQLTVTGPDECH